MTSPKWKISGDYFEACNCEINCPCALNSPPTYGECTGLATWQIKKGNYGNTPLDGLNAAGMYIVKGPALTGTWQIRLYIDKRANEEQRKALEDIIMGRKGGPLGRFAYLFSNYLGARYVPVKITVKGRTRTVTINDYANAKISEVKGEDGGQVILKNSPMSLTFGSDQVVAQSVAYKYSDDGREWEISGKTSYISKFTYTGP